MSDSLREVLVATVPGGGCAARGRLCGPSLALRSSFSKANVSLVNRSLRGCFAGTTCTVCSVGQRRDHSVSMLPARRWCSYVFDSVDPANLWARPITESY